MNPRYKLWIALALAAVGTAWRLYGIHAVDGLNEVHYAEGHLYFITAYQQPFWRSLFAPDAIYLVIPLRLISIVLIRWVGLVATYPIVFKVVTVAIQSLVYTVVLSDRFSRIGPFPVRVLVVAILMLAPWFETYLPYNTSYAYCFILLYALWSRSRHPVVLTIVFLSCFSKPAVLALIPIFLFRAVMAFIYKEDDRLPITLTALAGLSTQALFMATHGTPGNASVAQVYGHLPMTVLKNLLVGTGLSPLGLVWFPAQVKGVPTAWTIALCSALGLFLYAAWTYSLGHAWQKKDREGVLSFLLPLVCLPLSVALLMIGFLKERGFAWDLVGFLQDAAHRIHGRHTYFMAIVGALGILTLAQYWLSRFQAGPKVATALLSILLGIVVVGRLRDTVPYVRLEEASNWHTYHPFVRRDSYCIPINGFPEYAIEHHCRRLATDVVEATASSVVVPTLAARSQWTLQGLVVSWEDRAAATRQELKLVLHQNDGTETRVSSLTQPNAKFQYFDLGGVALRGRQLRVEIDGNPSPSGRHLALHYLGRDH